jgi:hypothetical protein
MDKPEAFAESMRLLGFEDPAKPPKPPATPDPMVQIRASDLAAIMAGAPPVPLVELECIAGELAEFEPAALNRLAAVEVEVQRLGGILLPLEEPWLPWAPPPSGPGPTAEQIEKALDQVARAARAFASVHAEFGNNPAAVGEHLDALEGSVADLSVLLQQQADAAAPEVAL